MNDCPMTRRLIGQLKFKNIQRNLSGQLTSLSKAAYRSAQSWMGAFCYFRR
jgi:hypothetical protein